MRSLMWIPMLLPVFVIKTVAENKTEDNNVFVPAGHAEADTNYRTTTETETRPDETTITTISTTRTATKATTELVFGEEPETVIFVPNERPVERFVDDSDESKVRIKDIMMMRSVGDVVDKTIHFDTEKPLEDIIFLSGKNTENIDEPPPKRRTEDSARRSGNRIAKKEKIAKIKLNCRDLDCNNTIKSLCGGKMEQKQWKHRLFLNECYFKKVNCHFKYENNRYKRVPDDKCKNMGIHQIPVSFKPKPYAMREAPEKVDFRTRRNYSSRRSMSMSENGQFCAHACPVSCPEEYEPECAVSGTGQKKVFLNHCKLDLNSCSFGVVWHRRPLAECVGSKKADVRQNRGFIGWMQRIGILDGKGRMIKQ